MKERGILFSAEMVKAILNGRKRQTRRLIEPQPGPLRRETIGLDSERMSDWIGEVMGICAQWRARCPYGEQGRDQLWVREAWRTAPALDKDNAKGIAKRALGAHYPKPWAPLQYEADGALRDWDESVWGKPAGRYRHARFMPRWASRLTLAVVDVRVERLQEISEADARAEGMLLDGVLGWHWPGGTTHYETAVGAFAEGWNALNGKRAPWKSNPWIWAVGFRLMQP